MEAVRSGGREGEKAGWVYGGLPQLGGVRCEVPITSREAIPIQRVVLMRKAGRIEAPLPPPLPCDTQPLLPSSWLLFGPIYLTSGMNGWMDG